MRETLTDFDILQIEMAAKGCISGTLEEWPALQRVFRKIGIHVSVSRGAGDVQQLCEQILPPKKGE